MFAYGLGYRMCTGTLLANRELYLIFLRVLAAFRVRPFDDVDTDPLTGTADAAGLVCAPRPYRVVFEPRDEAALREALGEGKV